MMAVEDMSRESFTAMIAVLKRISVKTIDIIGGEPTLYCGIVELIREAVQSGFSVNVSSNGSNLPELGKIMALGDQVSVGLSINDADTLGRAREFIKTRKPIVKTVFTRDLDPQLILKILSLKPRKFYLIYRDAAGPGDLTDTIPFHWFISSIEQRYDPTEVGTVYCSGFLPDVDNVPVLAQTRCPAGTTKLGVMPDGSTYPCNLFFGIKEYFLGNVLHDSFESIWSSSVLSFFRETKGNICGKLSCRFHGRCHGGCPAQALRLTGNLASPDPRCTNQ
jgi:radical SAM protein with 4Fe4S-binding SPASM domain